jgi:hypothetical protein
MHNINDIDQDVIKSCLAHNYKLSIKNVESRKLGMPHVKCSPWEGL